MDQPSPGRGAAGGAAEPWPASQLPGAAPDANHFSTTPPRLPPSSQLGPPQPAVGPAREHWEASPGCGGRGRERPRARSRSAGLDSAMTSRAMRAPLALIAALIGRGRGSRAARGLRPRRRRACVFLAAAVAVSRLPPSSHAPQAGGAAFRGAHTRVPPRGSGPEPPRQPAAASAPFSLG